MHTPTQTLAHKPTLGYAKSIFAVIIPILLFILISMTLSAKQVPGGTIAALWVYLLIPALYITFQLFSGKPVLQFSDAHSGHASGYVPGEEDHFIIHNVNHHLEHHGNPIRSFVKVFWILLVVTLIEIGIAYSSFSNMSKAMLFLFFTFVKAIYIAGTFMHLKDETKHLIWTIVLPVLFLIYFIFVLMTDSGYLLGHRLF